MQPVCREARHQLKGGFAMLRGRAEWLPRSLQECRPLTQEGRNEAVRGKEERGEQAAVMCVTHRLHIQKSLEAFAWPQKVLHRSLFQVHGTHTLLLLRHLGHSGSLSLASGLWRICRSSRRGSLVCDKSPSCCFPSSIPASPRVCAFVLLTPAAPQPFGPLHSRVLWLWEALGHHGFCRQPLCSFRLRALR
jgi:hypothetical protein